MRNSEIKRKIKLLLNNLLHYHFKMPQNMCVICITPRISKACFSMRYLFGLVFGPNAMKGSSVLYYGSVGVVNTGLYTMNSHNN